MKKLLILLTFLLSGCSTVKEWIDRPAPKPESDLPENITWLHTDVSGWPVTSQLSSVTVSGGLIHLPYAKARVWPGRDTAGAFVNANPWIVAQINGQWYAATWEWMRYGQTSKSVSAVAGDHIKRNPFPNDWRPTRGETYYFFVSGLARSHVRNVSERTNSVKVIWE